MRALALSIPVLLALTAGLAGADAVPGGPFTVVDGQEHGSTVQMQVTYPSGTETVRAWLFLPSGQDACPAVIFCHPGFGVDARVQSRCRELAEAGYVVLAPEYRIEKAARFTATPGETERILAGDALLRRHPRVNAHRVGIVGSSHGAPAALEAVAAGERYHFGCAVFASGNRWPEDRAAQIKTPLLVQVGKADREIDYQECRFTGLFIQKAGNSAVTIDEYTMAGHDFWFWTDPETFSADEISQGKWAWDDMLQFLGRYLATGPASAVR